MREDLTNQFGAYTPTESQAVRNIQREAAIKRWKKENPLPPKSPDKMRYSTPAESLREFMEREATTVTEIPDGTQRIRQDGTSAADWKPPDDHTEQKKTAEIFFYAIGNLAKLAGVKISRMELRTKGGIYFRHESGIATIEEGRLP